MRASHDLEIFHAVTESSRTFPDAFPHGLQRAVLFPQGRLSA